MKKFNFTVVFPFAMLLAILLATAYSLYQAKLQPVPPVPANPSALSNPSVDPVIKSAVPEAVEVQQISQNPLVIKIKKSDNTETYGAIGNGSGHNGNISVLVIMSPDHKISKVTVLSQSESPSKYRKLEGQNFLNQFVGKDVNSGFAVGKTIDAISSATDSSEGVTKAVQNASAALMPLH